MRNTSPIPLRTTARLFAGLFCLAASGCGSYYHLATMPQEKLVEQSDQSLVQAWSLDGWGWDWDSRYRKALEARGTFTDQQWADIKSQTLRTGQPPLVALVVIRNGHVTSRSQWNGLSGPGEILRTSGGWVLHFQDGKLVQWFKHDGI